MRLRLTILWIETRLLGLLVGEVTLLSTGSLILIFQLPLFLVSVWKLAGDGYPTFVTVYLLMILGAGFFSRKQLGPDGPSPDPPLRRSLRDDSKLDQFVRKVARRVGRSAPRMLQISLSPTPWHKFGVDLQRIRRFDRSITLSLSSLDVLSVSELEAQIARSLIAHRGPSWLFNAVQRAIDYLSAEHYQAQAHRSDTWIVRARERVLGKYLSAMGAWQFLVDLDADVRAAQIIGVEPVRSLACKEELSNGLAPVFISEVVEPALDLNVALPIANSYAAYATSVDPHWRDAVAETLTNIQGSAAAEYGTLAARLAVLSNLPSEFSVEDPRSASGMFSNFRQIERDVLANEFGQQRVERATEVSMSDWAQLVVLPQLREEVERNEGLLGGKTPVDIPELLGLASEMALSYVTNPRLLLAHAQREERIPYLLAAFLTIDLIDHGWELSHTFDEGISLRSGRSVILPFELVERLREHEISNEDFLDALR